MPEAFKAHRIPKETAGDARDAIARHQTLCQCGAAFVWLEIILTGWRWMQGRWDCSVRELKTTNRSTGWLAPVDSNGVCRTWGEHILCAQVMGALIETSETSSGAAQGFCKLIPHSTGCTGFWSVVGWRPWLQLSLQVPGRDPPTAQRKRARALL